MNFPEKKALVHKVQSYFPELKNDGVDGSNTWNALVNFFENANAMKEEGLAAKMVSLAEGEVGVEEVAGTNCGPRVDQYKAATWLDADEGWPWCAAFICWLFREAMKDGDYSFQRPQTASAWGFENWCRKQDSSVVLKKPTKGDIMPGDIVCFTFSHIGIAVSRPDSSGYVRTIEGNTDSSGSREGGGVFEKRRKLSQIRSRIRPLV